MNIDIYGDGIGFVTDEVSTVKTSEANLNEENRIKFVTDLAAVSRGKNESKNPPARYKSLLKEAAPTYLEYSKEDKEKYSGSPSRPLEFLPVKLLLVENGTYDLFDTNGNYIWEFSGLSEVNMLLSHSYIEMAKFGVENNYPDKLASKIAYNVFTNMRACINSGIPYEKIPYNKPEEIKDFVAIKACIPMFSWAQVPNTHTMISKEAETDRHKTSPKYWMPAGFREKTYEYKVKHAFEDKDEAAQSLYKTPEDKLQGSYPTKIMRQITEEVLVCQEFEMIPYLLTGGREKTGFKPTQEDVQHFFKEIGYPPEIYQRAMYYFKYKKVVMTGWNNDPKVWKHLLIERSTKPEIWKNWTQDVTKTFVNGIKQIIEGE